MGRSQDLELLCIKSTSEDQTLTLPRAFKGEVGFYYDVIRILKQDFIRILLGDEDFLGLPRTSRDLLGLPRTSPSERSEIGEVLGSPRTSQEVSGSPEKLFFHERILMKSWQNPNSILVNSNRILRLPMTSYDVLGLPRSSQDLPGPPRILASQQNPNTNPRKIIVKSKYFAVLPGIEQRLSGGECHALDPSLSQLLE